MKQRTSILMLASSLAVALPSVAFAKARSELRPNTELSIGRSAQLVVTIDGSDGSPPETIRTEGASIRLRGRMSRTSIINGSTRNETVFSYSVVPSQAGPLDIPAIAISTPGGTVRTQPIRATVISASSATNSDDREVRRDEPRRAFVTLDVPDKSLVVGQAVPIKIHAYFRAGTAATLQGLPELESDAFTLTDLSAKPAQREVEIRGEPYLRATWSAILSPAKPSAGKLVVELPVEIAYREMRARPERSIRDLLGDDPFGPGDPFDAFFSGADPFAGFDLDLDAFMDVGEVQRRTLTLTASGGQITVEEPPAANRPPGYRGAVGSFELAIEPPAGELRVGEPATITLRVTGTGNFERVLLDGLAEGPTWKAYSIDASFDAKTSKLSGTKTFTQTIVPTRDGALEVPAISFAYFDPDKRAYQVVATKPLTLEVKSAPLGADASLETTVDPQASANRVEREPGRATLSPRFRDPRFWMLPGGLAFATALLVGVGWWRRSPWVAGIVGERRTDRAVARALARADDAVRSGDVVGFFAAARRAFQVRLGDRFGIAPEAVTTRDVAERLGERGSTICTLFELADQVAYAKALTTAEPLEHWRMTVRNELAHLEADR